MNDTYDTLVNPCLKSDSEFLVFIMDIIEKHNDAHETYLYCDVSFFWELRIK